MGGEDKSFATTKQTVITAAISGAQLQLADLRPESEVILKLATDQKAATRITVQGE